MSKITQEEKLKIVLRYFNTHISIKDIAMELNVSKTIISGWIRLFEKQGPSAFVRTYTTHTLQFKMDVLRYMNETGISSVDAAAMFNISSSGLVRTWQSKWKQGGMNALQPMKKGRIAMKEKPEKMLSNQKMLPEDSVEALKAKIHRLEMENAYLKKLKTLVQSQEKLRTKIKRK